MPVPFRQWLLDRDLRLIEVAAEEFESMACNVLALAPGKCLMLDGNPRSEADEAVGVPQVWPGLDDRIFADGAMERFEIPPLRPGESLSPISGGIRAYPKSPPSSGERLSEIPLPRLRGRG